MPESKKPESRKEEAAPPQSGGDKVGDILKRERLTRRITIETIAKDLKLNVSYLKALEASDYAALPVDPYVRVYIKSLSKYLSLDTEAVMQQFYRERGLIADDYKNNGANKIDVSVQRQEKNPTVVIAAVLIVVLAVFAFIANQKGWLAQPAIPSAEAAAAKADSAGMDQESAQKQREDSLLANLNAPADSAAAASKTPPKP